MSTAFKRPATRKTYRTVDTLALMLRNGSITGAMHDAGQQFSQPVFARYLNVSKNLVSDWERGVKKPGGQHCDCSR